MMSTTTHHPPTLNRIVPPAATDFAVAAYGFANRVAALLLLVLFAPLFILIAVAVVLKEGRPVLFAHYRVGMHGALFRCLKFRTMARDAEPRLHRLLLADPAARRQWMRDHKLHDDPRVTAVGRLLRKTSLDELPQLINVVRGEMNLVGPRPIVVPELRKYGHAKFAYMSVRPGMTGLWQISGRNRTTYADRVRLDHAYVEHRSLWLDLRILVRTLHVVLSQEGV